MDNFVALKNTEYNYVLQKGFTFTCTTICFSMWVSLKQLLIAFLEFPFDEGWLHDEADFDDVFFGIHNTKVGYLLFVPLFLFLPFTVFFEC
jgi:hypothetical protein